MKGEEERGHAGRESEACLISFSGTGQSQFQEPEGHEVEDRRIGGVEEQAGQVIAEGLQAPEQVIHAEGHPGQGDVVAHVKGGPHPAEVGPAEPAVVKIV